MMAKKKSRKCNNPQCDMYNKRIEVATAVCRNCQRPYAGKKKYFWLFLFLAVLGAGGVTWWFYPNEVKTQLFAIKQLFEKIVEELRTTLDKSEKIKKEAEAKIAVAEQKQRDAEAVAKGAVDELETCKKETKTTTSRFFEGLTLRVKEQLGISNREMVAKFLVDVQDTVEQIQKNLSKIASSETPKTEKDKLISTTVDEFFVKNRSIIHAIDMQNPGLTQSSLVETYLRNTLATLSETRSGTVTLLFDNSYLFMEDIKHFEKDGKTTYTFRVDMWQMFEDCSRTDQPPCHKKYAKNRFHFISQIKDGSWQLRVESITTEYPISSREGKWE